MLQLTRALGYLETNDYVNGFIVMCAVLDTAEWRTGVRHELSAGYDVLRTERPATLVRIGEKQARTVAAGLRSKEDRQNAAANCAWRLHAPSILICLRTCAGTRMKEARGGRFGWERWGRSRGKHGQNAADRSQGDGPGSRFDCFGGVSGNPMSIGSPRRRWPIPAFVRTCVAVLLASATATH